MNESTMTNVATIQRRKYYARVSMNESIIANVATAQRRRFYANILMNESTMTNVLTTQLGTSCFLIAQGWRGTSLPWVSIRKEIQRRRC
ncbi:MAG: hypothetical protein ACFNUM_01345 [Segatella salivae]